MIVSSKICDPLSDQEIIQHALEETAFFSCLFSRYESKMLRYIKSIARLSDQEAEDVLQDAFIKVWKNLREFDNHLKASSWIYRIVHNETISAWRKKTSFGKNNTKDLDDEKQHVQLVGSNTNSDETEIDGKIESIHPILELMPAKYKEILVLRFLEDLSYEEISDVLKIPEGTVATRINRAKKKFAAIFNKINRKNE